MDNLTIQEQSINIESDSISVSQLNNLAKTLIENNMPVFWIKGEVSGLKNYSHAYFDLKDLNCKISCVIFARTVNTLGFKLENGQQIEVRGRVTIYPQNGSYQINVERVRQVGLGELWEAYTRLLNKLKLEGLFAPEYKKKIPVFPDTIGVITSKEGSVIRDVITTLKRRMPGITIIVYHSAVQGVDAGMQLVQALQHANRRREVDVLIICRGGGSMQDLWCFNEEVVAREVFKSAIPIISAVGHETDTTIIDYVSDLRAPTPTAAAELVSLSLNEWLNKIERLEHKLKTKLVGVINNKTQQLDLYLAALKYLNPEKQLKEKKHKIEFLKLQLKDSINSILDSKEKMLLQYKEVISRHKINSAKYINKLNLLENILKNKITALLLQKTNRLALLDKSLVLLNPENILTRGYAIIRSQDGSVISSAKSIKNHERLQLHLKDGVIGAIADKKYNPNQGELI